MKEMVTVTRNGDAIRISKITAHGEQIIEPDVEAKALAMLLWLKLSKSEPEGGANLFPWGGIRDRFDTLTAAVEKLTKALDKHSHEMVNFQIVANAAIRPTPVKRGQ